VGGIRIGGELTAIRTRKTPKYDNSAKISKISIKSLL
jgi:hypothetical protein